MNAWISRPYFRDIKGLTPQKVEWYGLVDISNDNIEIKFIERNKYGKLAHFSIEQNDDFFTEILIHVLFSPEIYAIYNW